MWILSLPVYDRVTILDIKFIGLVALLVVWLLTSPLLLPQRTPLGPLSAGRERLQKRQREWESKSKMGSIVEQQESISSHFATESRSKAAASKEGKSEKQKVVMESERVWLTQRERVPGR